jgi:hypothetical protein
MAIANPVKCRFPSRGEFACFSYTFCIRLSHSSSGGCWNSTKCGIGQEASVAPLSVIAGPHSESFGFISFTCLFMSFTTLPILQYDVSGMSPL